MIYIKSTIYFINNESIQVPQQDNNEDVIELNGINQKRDKWGTYTFHNQAVPRVSDILKETIGRDYLMAWAAKLGDAYQKESIHTLYIGTLVHELIDHFLLFGTKKKIEYRSYNVKVKTEKCYQNFLNWYHDKVNQGFRITPIYIEKPTVNPWFGGTIDCCMRLEYNGICKNYIMDFKTSKQISIDYIIQTYAYYWSEQWNLNYVDPNGIQIDGIGIIRVDKERDVYEDLILDFNNPDNLCFLHDIDTGLGSIINWYYHIQNLNYNLSQMKSKHVRKDGFVNGK